MTFLPIILFYFNLHYITLNQGSKTCGPPNINLFFAILYLVYFNANWAVMKSNNSDFISNFECFKSVSAKYSNNQRAKLQKIAKHLFPTCMCGKEKQPRYVITPRLG